MTRTHLPGRQERPALRGEVVATTMLGVGVGLSQLTQVLIGLTDTVMMARFGTEALAAGLLINAIVLTLFLFSMGLLQATAPAMGTALGNERHQDISTLLRTGNRLAIALSVFMVLLMLLIEPLLSVTGQQAEVRRLGVEYASWLIPGIWASLMLVMTRIYLTTMNEMVVLASVSFLGVVINAAANYVLMYGSLGFPGMGVAGCAASTSITNVAMFFVFHAIIRRRPGLTRHVYRAPVRPTQSALYRSIIALGLPIGFVLLSEYVVFTAAGLMMGRIGADELAAFAICMQWLSVFYMIPVGFSQAATTRTSFWIGRHDLTGIKSAAVSAITVGAAYCLSSLVVMFSFGGELFDLLLVFGNDQAMRVERFGESYMQWTAGLLFLSGLIVVCAGIMRGCRETKTPMKVVFLCYWVGGLGMAWLLGAYFGATGVWIGMMIGFTITCLGLAAALRGKLRNLPAVISTVENQDRSSLDIIPGDVARDRRPSGIP